MQLASLLINYLAKENNVTVPVCVTPDECFALYRELIGSADPSRLNAAYLKSEENYLKSRLADIGITNLDGFSYKLSVSEIPAYRLSADMLVNPVGDIMDDLYLYGGSRLKAVCMNIEKDTVTSGFALDYKGIFSTPSPKIQNRLTSDNVAQTRRIYNAAADCAVKNNVKSIVFLPIITGNKLMNQQVLKIAAETVAARDDLKDVKKVFSVNVNGEIK